MSTTSDTEFVQQCADKWGVGFATRGQGLGDLANMLLALLKTREVESVRRSHEISARRVCRRARV